MILGFDEVGRGALAGPVVVGCVLGFEKKVILPSNIIVRDSKKMTKIQRKKTSDWILNNFSFGIGQVQASEIDKLGIVKATRLAAQRAMFSFQSSNNIDISSFQIIVDGIENWFENCQTMIGGDGIVFELSMASIIAKVYRDNLMSKLSSKYLNWGFEKHVGYGTKYHQQMLKDNGLIKDFHRRSFCKKYCFDSK